MYKGLQGKVTREVYLRELHVDVFTVSVLKDSWPFLVRLCIGECICVCGAVCGSRKVDGATAGEN